MLLIYIKHSTFLYCNSWFFFFTQYKDRTIESSKCYMIYKIIYNIYMFWELSHSAGSIVKSLTIQAIFLRIPMVYFYFLPRASANKKKK